MSSLHVTALDQSYFFIRRVNFMRYNKIVCGLLIIKTRVKSVHAFHIKTVLSVEIIYKCPKVIDKVSFHLECIISISEVDYFVV